MLTAVRLAGQAADACFRAASEVIREHKERDAEPGVSDLETAGGEQ